MKISQIKKSATELIITSTLHGLPNIARAKNNYLAFTWLTCLSISSAMLSYLSAKMISNFLQYETTTSIDVINESPNLFPCITICNLNGKKQKSLVNETIISCRFDNMNCSWTDFITINMAAYGNCFTFNGRLDSNGNFIDRKMSFMPGKYQGFTVELFSKPGTEETFSNGYGYHIFVHNISDNLDILVNGVDIAPGFQTNIVVDRVFYYKQSIPYFDCFIDLESYYSFDSILVKQILKEKKVYEQLTCFEYCRVKQAKNKCNCNLTNSLGNCENNNADKDCALVLYSNFYNFGYKECLSYCPLECNTQDFKLATSFLDYPHFSKVETLINNPIIKGKFPKETNISIQDLKQSISSLYVYYEDRKYTVIRKEPKMTLLDLISNIGGIMGIFIGASFLSFVELFELLFLIICGLVRN